MTSLRKLVSLGVAVERFGSDHEHARAGHEHEQQYSGGDQPELRLRDEGEAQTG